MARDLSRSKFDAPEDYPDFTGHVHLVSRHLTLDVYKKLRDVMTSSGFTLEKAIQNGIDNQDFKVGILAGDEETYTVYSQLFDPIIRDYHNGFEKEDKHITDLDPEGLRGPDELDPKYVISSRIRAGRNIRGYCLSPHISRSERRHVETIVSQALTGIRGHLRGKYHDIPRLSRVDRQKLRKGHFLFDPPVSRHSRSGGMARDFPDGRGIWYNDDKNFFVWVNEEDHMRIISMENGGNMKRVFTRFVKGLTEVERCMKGKGTEFMYNDHLGYIMTCPTNLGTGIRCSVHVKLPNLSADCLRFDKICRAYRLQQRGTGGEFTDVVGGVYDISNIDRLGTTEVQQVQCVIDGVQELIKLEKCLEKGGNTDDDQLQELLSTHNIRME